jgi:hypothetical protein
MCINYFAVNNNLAICANRAFRPRVHDRSSRWPALRFPGAGTDIEISQRREVVS